MSSGIDLNRLPKKYKKDLEKKLIMVEQKFKDCFKWRGSNVQLTSKGILFANISVDTAENMHVEHLQDALCVNRKRQFFNDLSWCYLHSLLRTKGSELRLLR